MSASLPDATITATSDENGIAKPIANGVVCEYKIVSADGTLLMFAASPFVRTTSEDVIRIHFKNELAKRRTTSLTVTAAVPGA